MKPSLIRKTITTCACAAFACALAPSLATQTNAGFRMLIDNTPAASSPAPTPSEKSKTNTARAVFSDTTKPGTLMIFDAINHVEIQGVADDEVSVSSPLASGIQSSTTTYFELHENNNLMSLNVRENGDRMESMHDFKIRVPRNTKIFIETYSIQSDRRVTIADIAGNVGIRLVNGDIALKNTTGALIIDIKNSGTIAAEMNTPPAKPIMLTSTGNIDLTLPASAAANVRMSARYGSARTNFSEDAFKISSPSELSIPAERLAAIRAEIARRRQQLGIDDATAHAPASAAADSDAQSEDERIKAIMAEIVRKRQARENGETTSASAVPALSIGGNSITGKLNGGGTDIRLTTGSGVITLKQAQ